MSAVKGNSTTSASNNQYWIPIDSAIPINVVSISWNQQIEQAENDETLPVPNQDVLQEQVYLPKTRIGDAADVVIDAATLRPETLPVALRQKKSQTDLT